MVSDWSACLVASSEDELAASMTQDSPPCTMADSQDPAMNTTLEVVKTLMECGLLQDQAHWLSPAAPLPNIRAPPGVCATAVQLVAPLPHKVSHSSWIGIRSFPWINAS